MNITGVFVFYWRLGRIQMTQDRLFDSLGKRSAGLRRDLEISQSNSRGLVVVYTKEYDKVSGNNKAARDLAQSLHKRVDIRPDPSTLGDPSVVEGKLRSMIPEAAGIFDIFFNDETGEAIVEAIKPDVVKGDEGSLILNLKQETGWNVKVIRTPPIPSKTISDVRDYPRAYRDDRHDSCAGWRRSSPAP